MKNSCESLFHSRQSDLWCYFTGVPFTLCSQTQQMCPTFAFDRLSFQSWWLLWQSLFTAFLHHLSQKSTCSQHMNGTGLMFENLKGEKSHSNCILTWFSLLSEKISFLTSGLSHKSPIHINWHWTCSFWHALLTATPATETKVSSAYIFPHTLWHICSLYHHHRKINNVF